MKIGCNYWASHAGVRMWELWDAANVEDDFRHLASIGCNMVRVFPNWKDFQPIDILPGWRGELFALQMHGHDLPDTPCGRDGVDEEMLRRFRRLTEIAAENGIELVVGIVTGWMSGMLLVPPALSKLNLICDPLALKWEVRFVRRFVSALKDCPAIRYWELGNESNCLGAATDTQAWMWTNTIASAIRLADPSRPVASGMHSLMPGEEAPNGRVPWSIETQGEHCDVMTSHPYPHSPSKLAARVDPHNTIRTAFQATVETLFYADIGGKPGAVEEIGTFSPSYCAEKEKAEFLQNSICNAWAHNSRYFLWWCGFDFSDLDFPPYDWSAWERELGLFDIDKQAKPVAGVFRDFSEFLKREKIAELPPFQRDAICLTTRDQDFDDTTENCWNAILLAKMCGFDVRLRHSMDGIIPEAPVYILPGLRCAYSLRRSSWLDLLERVKNGATLYVSLYDGALAPFESVFGVETRSREARVTPAHVKMGEVEFTCSSPFRLSLRLLHAEALACEEDGNPVFTRAHYGKGEVYLLTLPLEKDLAGRPGAFSPESALKLREVYRAFAAPALARRRLFQDAPLITLTEHPLPGSGDRCLAVAVNNSDREVLPEYRTAPGWRLETPARPIAPFHCALLCLRRG